MEVRSNPPAPRAAPGLWAFAVHVARRCGLLFGGRYHSPKLSFCSTQSTLKSSLSHLAVCWSRLSNRGVGVDLCSTKLQSMQILEPVQRLELTRKWWRHMWLMWMLVARHRQAVCWSRLSNRGVAVDAETGAGAKTGADGAKTGANANGRSACENIVHSMYGFWGLRTDRRESIKIYPPDDVRENRAAAQTGASVSLDPEAKPMPASPHLFCTPDRPILSWFIP